jgi:hypothetical protein
VFRHPAVPQGGTLTPATSPKDGESGSGSRNVKESRVSSSGLVEKEKVLLEQFRDEYAELQKLRIAIEVKREELKSRNSLISAAREYLSNLDAYSTQHFRKTQLALDAFIEEHTEKKSKLEDLRKLSFCKAWLELLGADDPIGSRDLGSFASEAISTPEVKKQIATTIVGNEAQLFPQDNQSSRVADLSNLTPATLNFFSQRYDPLVEKIYDGDFPTEMHEYLRFGSQRRCVKLTLEGYLAAEEGELKTMYKEVEETQNRMMKIRSQVRIDSAANSEIGNILRAELDLYNNLYK